MIPYLETFFAEKQLPYASWCLTDDVGIPHLIDTSVVFEHIELADAEEQTKIADVIRKIDFRNGDVNDFLKHLAGALINRRD